MAEKKKPDLYPQGISEAMAAMRAHFGKRPLFVPPTRRYIQMRHRALAHLLGGDMHPGLPTGCVIETLGMAGSGKTTLAMAMADAVINQPEGMHKVWTHEGEFEFPVPRKVAVLDFEQTMDAQYMTRAIRNCQFAVPNGKGGIVNLREANMFVHQPDTLEEGGEVMMHLVGSGEIGLVVIDSVPAMLAEEERSKRMDENTVGLLAKAVSKLLRKSVHLLRRYNVTLVVINQWRDKIGVKFGDPRVAPGGKSLEYFDAIRLDVSGPHRTPWFTNGKIANVKTMKNKVSGVRKQVATYHLGHGVGLSAEVELAVALQQTGLLEWKGKSNSKVVLLPRGRSKTFGAMPEFIAWAERMPDKTRDQLWAAAEGKGYAISTAPQSSGWEE